MRATKGTVMDMKHFTPEMIARAKQATSVEELLALAKDNHIELTEEEANTFFARNEADSRELADDELDNVSGGGCGGSVAETFKVGDKVKIRDGLPYKCNVCSSQTGSYIPYNNGNWGVMCDRCNDGTLVVLFDGACNPAGTIEKI